jgi:hypothetical protein
MDERSTTLRRLEPRAVSLKKSGVTTRPLDRVAVILIQYQKFKVFELDILRAGNILDLFH